MTLSELKLRLKLVFVSVTNLFNSIHEELKDYDKKLYFTFHIIPTFLLIVLFQNNNNNELACNVYLKYTIRNKVY